LRIARTFTLLPQLIFLCYAGNTKITAVARETDREILLYHLQTKLLSFASMSKTNNKKKMFMGHQFDSVILHTEISIIMADKYII